MERYFETISSLGCFYLAYYYSLFLHLFGGKVFRDAYHHHWLSAFRAPPFLHLFGGKVFRDNLSSRISHPSGRFKRFLHLFGGKVFRDLIVVEVRKRRFYESISPPIWWKGISRQSFEPVRDNSKQFNFSTYLVERYFETFIFSDNNFNMLASISPPIWWKGISRREIHLPRHLGIY